MNQDQVLSLVRGALNIAGPAILATGWVSGNTWAEIVAMAPTVAGLVWGLFAHTHTATVQAAAALPGVKPIEISPVAPVELQKLAADPSVRNVVRG